MNYVRNAFNAIAILAVVLTLALSRQDARAARHPLKVGTITAIGSSSLTIHSKTHAADYTFAIVGNTRFLQHGQPADRGLFKRGAYVTVSYTVVSGKWQAYHVSLRRHA